MVGYMWTRLSVHCGNTIGQLDLVRVSRDSEQKLTKHTDMLGPTGWKGRRTEGLWGQHELQGGL
jgi:hypothetical protein